LSALSTDNSILPSLAYQDSNKPPLIEILTLSSLLIKTKLEKIIVMIEEIVEQSPSLDIVQEHIDLLRTCMLETLSGLDNLITFCTRTRSHVVLEYDLYYKKNIDK